MSDIAKRCPKDSRLEWVSVQSQPSFGAASSTTVQLWKLCRHRWVAVETLQYPQATGSVLLLLEQEWKLDFRVRWPFWERFDLATDRKIEGEFGGVARISWTSVAIAAYTKLRGGCRCRQ